MGLSTVSQNLNAIWQDYLKHLAFAMRNLNMIIDSPIIISGYLAPYLVPEDLNMLLHLINENNPFTLTADQSAGRIFRRPFEWCDGCYFTALRSQ